MRQVDRFGGGSVLVWAGINHVGRTAVILVDGALTGVRYRDEILQPYVIPHMAVNGVFFQQDNTKPHATRVCQDFLQDHNVQTLAWSACSSDLSPIGRLWYKLDRHVRHRNPSPQTLQQLELALQDDWLNIPCVVVVKL